MPGIKFPLTEEAHEFAREVVSGRVNMCQAVEAVCDRHLARLKQTPDGFYFLDEKSEHAMTFLQRLTLPKGEHMGRPFELFDWQKFITACGFGWHMQDDDGDIVRQYVRIYLETAKGSGKSPWVAAIGLYGTAADGEGGAENFVVSSNERQASVVFDMARLMVHANPTLDKHLDVMGGNRANKIIYSGKDRIMNCSLQLITTSIHGGEKGGKSGPMAHFILADELHEFRNPDVLDILVAGFKSRKQPMMIMTTNSGEDAHTTCGQEHDRAIKIAIGEIVDLRYLPFVATCDEQDKPLEDEGVWDKANPSLRFGLPRRTYLRAQVAEAKASSLKRPTIERLNFGIWGGGLANWIDEAIWIGAETDELTPERMGAECWLSVDLSETKDLSGVGATWRIEEDWGARFEHESFAFLPGDDVDERALRDLAQYQKWADGGFLYLSKENTINLADVALLIKKLWDKYEVAGLTFDRWNFRLLKTELQELEIPMHTGRGAGLLLVEHPQGHFPGKGGIEAFNEGRTLHMPASTKITEEMLRKGLLKVKYNPVLSWAASNVRIEPDRNLNPAPVKKKSKGRIDPAIALIQGAGAAFYQPTGIDSKGIYQWARDRALEASPDQATEDLNAPPEEALAGSLSETDFVFQDI